MISLSMTLNARKRQGKATRGSPEGKRGKEWWRREQEKGGNMQGEAGGHNLKGEAEQGGG